MEVGRRERARERVSERAIEKKNHFTIHDDKEEQNNSNGKEERRKARGVQAHARRADKRRDKALSEGQTGSGKERHGTAEHSERVYHSADQGLGPDSRNNQSFK